MEKLGLLLFIFQINLIWCSKNFQNDDLVSRNNIAKHFEAKGGGGPQSQVANFFSDIMLLDFQSSGSGSSQCKIHMNEVLEEAGKLNIWALKMLDASAKLPSGILNGNLNQYGHFDQCLSSEGYSRGHKIQAKYCLVTFNVRPHGNTTNEKIKELDTHVHSNWLFHNNFRDEGHRMPKFETFNMGVCIPSSCNSKEIEDSVTERWNKVTKNTFFFEVAVDDELCYVKDEKVDLSLGRLAAWFLLASILCTGLWATFVDVKKIKIANPKLHKTLQCFSLKKNFSSFLKPTSSQDDINCIHGIRFLNAIALLHSHKKMAMLFNPIMNRTELSEAVNGGWTMIGRAAILYTESFNFLSGFLVAYSIIKDLDNKKKMNFKDKVINRIIRLSPNLISLILFFTYVMDIMGSGPQWGLVVNKYRDLCKKYMWRNFLFIQNHFGFQNLCLTHTHQLGTDMHLFLFSPVFIYLLWKIPKAGTAVAIGATAFSAWLRYDLTVREKLSAILFYGISVERLWRSANTFYITPTHRLSVYLMGIWLGYYFRRGGRNLKLNRIQAIIGWIIGSTAGFLAIFGYYHMGYKDYKYDVTEAATFNACGPILWSVFISWIILACCNGYGGYLNNFLSWKYLTVFTKISYAFYLTQFPIFFYNVGTERLGVHYQGLHSLVNVFEFAAVFMASTLLTLCYDMPFQELKKSYKSPQSDKKNEELKTPNGAEIMQEKRYKTGKKRLETFGS